MNFLEALKTGRPMCRQGPWLFLGKESSSVISQSCWRRIDTGEVVGLHSWDYLATDWKVMP